MPFWENMPYTNFHGTNQDWIIETMKKLVQEWAEYGDNLQQAYDAFTASVNEKIADLNGDWTDYKDKMNAAFADLHDYVYNYFDNLDVQDEIDHKLDEMTAQGLWDDILHSFFDSYSAEIDQKVAEQDDQIEDQTQRIDVMRAEMDAFLQSHGTVSATLRQVVHLWTGSATTSDPITLSGLLSDYDRIEVRVTAWGQNSLQIFKPSDFFTTAGASFRTTNQTAGELSPAILSAVEVNIKAADHEEGVEVTNDVVTATFNWWRWHGGVDDEGFQSLGNSSLRLREINGIKYTDISAEKDPELTDIRVGANGTVYPTAGDAIRDQIGNINNPVEIKLKFVLGGINNSDGLDNDPSVYKNRCRSNFVLLKEGYTYTSAPDHEFVFYEYDPTTCAYIAPMHSAYVTEYEMERDAYVRVVERKTDNTEITDLAPFKLFKSKISTAANDIKNIASIVGNNISPSWAIGSLNATGQETGDTNNTRLRTSFYSISENDIVRVKLNDQRVAVCLYDNNYNFLLNTGWNLNDFNIKNFNGLLRFVVANLDDSTPISTVNAKITIYSDIQKTCNESEDIINGFIGTPFNQTLKVIMHRGYNSIAPENTIPAFTLAKKMGFSTIETDIQLTSDNHVVVLHDATVNRTSNGSGNIYNMTLEQAQSLDFGSWKSPMYAGTKIPTFEEMLLCCKQIGLDVYIEIKQDSPWTQELITECVRNVRKYGMCNHVTWISFSSTILGYVKTADAKARLGYLMTTYTTSAVDTCISLKSTDNDVLAVTRYDLLTDTVLDYLIDNNIPLCAYLFDSCTDADAMQPYVTEALTNKWNVAKYIYEQNID